MEVRSDESNASAAVDAAPCGLLDLPVDLFCARILSLLSYADVRALRVTCRGLRSAASGLRRTLNRENSARFAVDASFRESVASAYALDTLTVAIHRPFKKQQFWPAGPPRHPMYEYLRDYGGDLTVFRGLRALVLDGDVLGMAQYEVMRALSSLQGLRKVSLRSFMLDDLSGLAGIPEVEVVDCPMLRDISPLSRAHTVSVADCRGVCDVSPLANAHRVHLRACDGLSDVSPLSRVDFLHIEDCPYVPTVPFTGRRLKLRALMGLTDASHIACDDLEIDDCPLSDVAPLAKHRFRRVALANIPAADVSALAGVADVSLTALRHVQDVSALAHAHKVRLISMVAIEEWSVGALARVPCVDIALDSHPCELIGAFMLALLDAAFGGDHVDRAIAQRACKWVCGNAPRLRFVMDGLRWDLCEELGARVMSVFERWPRDDDALLVCMCVLLGLVRIGRHTWSDAAQPALGDAHRRFLEQWPSGHAPRHATRVLADAAHYAQLL